MDKNTWTTGPEAAEKFKTLVSPHLAYRFRVRFTGKWLSKEQHEALTANVLSVAIDYLQKKLVIQVRQNAYNALVHEAISDTLSKDYTIIHVDGLSGANEEPLYILEFAAKPESHDFKFDYRNSDVATHTMEFSFESMTPYNRKEEVEED